MKYFLNVPYREKDAVKAQGARWDPVLKKWYYEGDALPDSLSRWSPMEPPAAGLRKGTPPEAVTPAPLNPSQEGEAAVPDPYANYLSVSALNQMIAEEFSRTASFRQILVRGEVTNYSGHKQNYYFSVKDAYAELSCVLFESTASTALHFELQNGQAVALVGRLDYYEKSGKSQLLVRQIENIGEGLQKLALLKLRAKLEAEGLFDPAHKQPIPRHAKTIGIVTSANGQAVRDICKITKKRCPSVQLILYPVNVQGSFAAKTTVQGIRTLDRLGVDVIIVGRGGGSEEELSAYNDESIVRAIYEAKTPIVSAVGHAGNHSFTDDAADFFAATPSEAAEITTADTAAVIAQIEGLRRELSGNLRRMIEMRRAYLTRSKDRLQRSAESALNARRHRIEILQASMKLHHPKEKLKTQKKRLIDADTKLRGLMERSFSLRSHRLEVLLSALHGLSPTAKLVNGYGYIALNGQPLTRVSSAKAGDELNVRIHDGEIRSTVTEVIENEHRS